ncbi:hypothetical protein GOP47_0024902 [Adiantum capillus-veneris]|uniref:SHSP domain-containing protein n=1 Tax=Adiantum capillus-veneris TaxID=13818 RepID=A0A9D4U345_ADICA|nr:hypothetical protein GOP47_0024902 [Adiantum capillus-veneris]
MAVSTPVDVKELHGSFIFVVDVPGLRNTDVKVQIEKDSILKIYGERKREIDNKETSEVKYVRVERPTGRFMRRFNLPNHINLETMSAACQDGLLTIVVPKTPESPPHEPRSFDVPVGSTLLKEN